MSFTDAELRARSDGRAALQVQVAEFINGWDAELASSIHASEQLIAELDAAVAAADAQRILRVSARIRDIEHEALSRRTDMLSAAVALLREATS